MPQQVVSLAILFADISGSTHLYEALGDLPARQMVAQCLSLLTEVIHRHQGTVVKTIGDEIMSTFPSADLAVQAACAMQEALAEEQAEATTNQPALTIRVGLHFGLVILEAGDVFGDAVNVAARMVALAKAGQILTTQQTVEALAPESRASTRHLDRTPVKGKQEEIDIHEVIWQAEGLTRMEARRITPEPPQARLRLRFGDREIELSRDRPVATVGRSKQNDIVIDDEFASRVHARIEYRRGRFVLLDQSTNGTFVLSQDGERAHLRREELPLRGTGVISLGRALSAESAEVIHFTCES